jgi:hypothetical protein
MGAMCGAWSCVGTSLGANVTDRTNTTRRYRYQERSAGRARPACDGHVTNCAFLGT